MKRKTLLLIVMILFIGLSIAGGTYAFLTTSVNPTNNSYNTVTGCFNIDYSINNSDNTQNISGTLFPSAGVTGGLSGRVSLKTNSTCAINGIGTLKLHINSGTASALMTSASSYCEDRKTMTAISGISTEAACETAGGRWRGYGDSYCEDIYTLQRLTDYTDSASCANNAGTWKSGGSPLKYAVYNNASAVGIPISKGYITSSNIGNDIIIADDIYINSTQLYYYIFVWIDGYLVGNESTNLPFNGYIKAEAMQDPYVYTVNVETNVTIGNALPSNVIQYPTAEAAMAAYGYPVFLRHRIQNGVVSESYVGVGITNALSTSYRQVGEVYVFRGGVNESSLTTKPISDNNVLTAARIFNVRPGTTNGSYNGHKDNLYIALGNNGYVEAYDESLVGDCFIGSGQGNCS